MLHKIECYIQPSKLYSIKDTLIEQGIDGMTVSQVEGFGRQRGYISGEVPNKEAKFLPKYWILLNIICSSFYLRGL